jgi:predicted PurR-regulated permease PerM
MSFSWPIAFWIAMLAALSPWSCYCEWLLPFVAGMVLAYLLDPQATRLDGSVSV